MSEFRRRLLENEFFLYQKKLIDQGIDLDEVLIVTREELADWSDADLRSVIKTLKEAARTPNR